MATNFPSSLDSFTNPTAVDTLDSPPHDTQHANANDAIEAIEAALLDGAPLHIDDANERVGVGNASPSYKLDVTGDINASGALRIGGTALGTYIDHSASQSFGGFTLGNGTVTCSYTQIGKLVHYSGQVALGSTSTIPGPLDLVLPVPSAYGFINNTGSGFFWQSGQPLYTATVTWLNTTGVRLQRFQVTATNAFVGDVGGSTPFTWAAGDAFTWNVVYRAA